MKKAILVFISLIASGACFSQNSTLKGRIYNGINNEVIPFAVVAIEGTNLSATADIDGNYKIENISPGQYTVISSAVGFKKRSFYEIQISSVKPYMLDIALDEEVKLIEEVEIKASPMVVKEESPLSMRTINTTEIMRNPGGNRDISKVIQSLPGVASTASFRNDIIIRGGAPNENRFYIDGIEVPNINHFATQGSSGGPVGMINVNFIREVEFYSGSFPANRGNALSSVFEFKQQEGNNEKLVSNFMVGSSDVGLTLDGPIGKNSTFILSARRSYLQFLFKTLSLPFLPTYNDFQIKNIVNINEKNKLTIIGLGAIDDFKLNTDVNDGINDSLILERNNYILGYLPVNTQWNYTTGMVWQHFRENSFQTIVVSRNHLNNNSFKYFNNVKTPANKILDYNSQEVENKLRIENTFRRNTWKLNVGIGYEYITYLNNSYQKLSITDSIVEVIVDSKLNFNKYSAFAQLSNKFLNNRLAATIGLRTDFNDYSPQMSNPWKQLSPRLSLSYSLVPKLNISFNTGWYQQLPAYTVLGYREKNILTNKQNKVEYINVLHLVSGIEYLPSEFSKVSLEGFYKKYNNYPFLLTDSVSLANLGGDFGVIGNAPVSSISTGRSYGIELLAQQRLSKKIYGIVAYTWVKSEFQDKYSNYRPSSWDNRHIISLTGGYKFKNNWELGMKFRFLGGAPYTPYNITLSSKKAVWDIYKQGIADYNRLNEKRNSSSHGIDFRLDKKWFFTKWSLNAYLDIQNVYNNQTYTRPILLTQNGADGIPLTDPNNPSSYLTKTVDNPTGTVLPSIGLMIEF